MLEPDNLNPLEVLSHLESLGFRDVTPQQLTDFVHDLKRLIRYEQRHGYVNGGKCHSLTSECSCEESCESAMSESDNNTGSYESSIVSDCGSSTLYEMPVKDTGRPRGPKVTTDRSHLSKVQSSFIRPRNLQSSRDNSFKSRKNLDPVNLYHHYKEIWNRNKIPGQSNHLQLRWDIRNKMLG